MLAVFILSLALAYALVTLYLSSLFRLRTSRLPSVKRRHLLLCSSARICVFVSELKKYLLLLLMLFSLLSSAPSLLRFPFPLAFWFCRCLTIYMSPVSLGVLRGALLLIGRTSRPCASSVRVTVPAGEVWLGIVRIAHANGTSQCAVIATRWRLSSTGVVLCILQPCD